MGKNFVIGNHKIFVHFREKARDFMGVRVREKPKGSGIHRVFINHHGRRKAKKIGKDKRLAREVAKKPVLLSISPLWF